MVDLTNYRFANGGRDNGYPGIPIINGTQILETIAQTLEDSNWTINDHLSDGHYFIGKGTTQNGHNCWFKFFDDQVGTIKIYGDFDGGNTILSPFYAVTYPTTGLPARLYVSSKEDSGAFSVHRLNNYPNPTMEGCLFGFVNRELITDQYAAYVANLTPDACIKASVMKHLASGENWRVIGSDFNTGNIFTGGNTHPVYSLDYLMGFKPYTDYTSGSQSNPAYNFFNGMPNGINQTFDYAPLFFMESINNNTSYGGTSAYLKENLACPIPHKRRGYHPFALSGFSNVAMAFKGEKTSASGITRVGMGLGVGKIGMFVDIFEAA